MPIFLNYSNQLSLIWLELRYLLNEHEGKGISVVFLTVVAIICNICWCLISYVVAGIIPFFFLSVTLKMDVHIRECFLYCIFLLNMVMRLAYFLMIYKLTKFELSSCLLLFCYPCLYTTYRLFFLEKLINAVPL